jgi:hypothetical protein
LEVEIDESKGQHSIDNDNFEEESLASLPPQGCHCTCWVALCLASHEVAAERDARKLERAIIRNGRAMTTCQSIAQEISRKGPGWSTRYEPTRSTGCKDNHHQNIITHPQPHPIPQHPKHTAHPHNPPKNRQLTHPPHTRTPTNRLTHPPKHEGASPPRHSTHPPIHPHIQSTNQLANPNQPTHPSTHQPTKSTHTTP